MQCLLHATTEWIFFMSLMGTLAKVAIGVAVAKGAQSILANKGGSRGEGGAFGDKYSPEDVGSTGNAGDILGDLLGGSGQGGSGQGGGLGGLLDGLSEKSGGGGSRFDDEIARAPEAGGGLGQLIEGLTGAQGGKGGLGDLLGGLAGMAGAAGGSKGGFGEILNQSFQKRGEPEVQPSREQDAVAGLMLKAMIQAAKSDGKIDDAERQKLLNNLGDVSQAEREFVNQEISAPIDAEGLARQVPNGMGQQVYAMSLLGIDLDNRNEAQYLHSFATALNLDRDTVNRVHRKMGAREIY